MARKTARFGFLKAGLLNLMIGNMHLFEVAMLESCLVEIKIIFVIFSMK